MQDAIDSKSNDGMDSMSLDFQPPLEALFSEAERNGGLQYIFTLLRVTGITRSRDPLIELESILQAKERTFPKEDSTVQAHILTGIEESLSLIGNLLNCSIGKTFSHPFFLPLYKGSFPDITKPTVEEMLQYIQHHVSETSNSAEMTLLCTTSLAALFDREASESRASQLTAMCFLQTLITVYNF